MGKKHGLKLHYDDVFFENHLLSFKHEIIRLYGLAFLLAWIYMKAGDLSNSPLQAWWAIAEKCHNRKITVF